MNFQTAGIVASVAFLLSFLSGLLGGVPLLDILLRALVWAVVGFGASLGIEMLLKSLVPDLFVAQEEPAPEEDEVSGRSVNITLDDDLPVRKGGFVEEVDDEEPASPYRNPSEPRVSERAEPMVAVPHSVSAPEGPGSPGGDEEMPEIGSFLDAFKPEAPEGEEEASSSPPEYGEYAPVESSRRGSSGEVTIDGEVQDPVILAKAVQTVMKRDAQGN